MQSSLDDLRVLFEGHFTTLLTGVWAQWRKNYIEQINIVAAADAKIWSDPTFQQRLWDNASVSSVGPGQSVTLVKAYTDQELAKLLLDARGSLDGLPLEQRGARLQKLYDHVLSWVHPRYTPRRPKARLVRLLAAMFPDDMTCLMDAERTRGVQRQLAAVRLQGDFIAQNPALRERVREALGITTTVEATVDQSMFTWFLWQEVVDKSDESTSPTQAPHREASAVPPFSLLPANAQRRSLTCVKNNLDPLMAMVREAEQGIIREDLVGVILSEATQLNASSAGNIISQAMGGLGLIRLDGNTYRPTERGLEMLTATHPAHLLRSPLVSRVFGMGHFLRMVQNEPGKLRPIDTSTRLKSLVPTWTSTQPGSHIFSWARIADLVQLDHSSGGGRLVLTEDGEDYVAALPDNFEDEWRIQKLDESSEADPSNLTEDPASNTLSVGTSPYGIDAVVADGCFLLRNEIEAAIELLRRKKNLILQGPPGTGKTWLAKRLGYALLGVHDPERLTAVQFQPSLSYEDFVRGWRPDGAGGLQLADGVFLDAVTTARQDPTRPYVLVIEEINRGNPAQILGELLTLIEDSKRRPDEALRLTYPRTVDERVYVPDNLHIIGTMNLADRSLALVDLALRRRFAFVSLTPLLNDAWRKWMSDLGCPTALLDSISTQINLLNAAIAGDRTLGEQFQIGHSFVTPLVKPGSSDKDWSEWYGEVARTEIAPLLREYWYDRQEEATAQIAKLGA